MGLYRQHAWAKTVETFGGWATVLALVVFPLIGFLLHFLISGREAMSAELYVWVIYALAPSGLIFTLLFAWNFACAPFRIERDKRVELEAKLSEFTGVGAASIEEIVRGRDRFPMWEAACLLAGVPAQKNPTGMASSYLYRIKKTILEDREAAGYRNVKTGTATPEQLIAGVRPHYQLVDEFNDNDEITREQFADLAMRFSRKVPGL